jgi:hypothetical protein
MTPSKMWDAMNELEMVTTKVVSAREIIDCASDAIQNNDYSRAETLISAAYEFLGYYLDEFDKKFKYAWKETVVANSIDDGMRPWGHSDIEYQIANSKKNKVTKWIVPVEESHNPDTDEPDYIIKFPDDLMEQANWQEGDTLEWIDNNDGSFTLKKVWQDPYAEEMTKAGYEKVNGVWTLGE